MCKHTTSGQLTSLGTITTGAGGGDTTVTIKPTKIPAGKALMNIRRVTLE